MLQRLASFFRRIRPASRIATASYKPVNYHQWGYQPRELPPFSFMTVQTMLIDPTIRLGLAMRAAPLYGLEFAQQTDTGEWQPGIQSTSDEVGKFVLRQLRRLWMDLDAVLTSQIWGWSGGEVTFRRTASGLVEIDRLLPRHANDIRCRTRDGELAGIRVLRCPETDRGYVDLDWPKAWWHAYHPECGLWYGDSALLGCYSPWFDKWMDGGGLDVRRLFMHKDAYAGADMTYPEGTQYVPGKGDIPNRDIAREIVEQVVAGGVTARPAAYDSAGHELWQLTRATVASNPAHILQYPRDLDTEILRGLECPDDVLTADQNSTGAWAGKRVPMSAFYASLDRWALSVIRDLDKQIIRPIVRFNFGPGQEYQIQAKPLATQAMEQQQTSGGSQPGGDSGSGDLFGENPGTNRRPPPGQPPKPGPPPSSPGQRLNLESAVGRGELSAVELVKAAQRIIRMRAEDPSGARWITIGGRKGEDGEHEGGFPIQIDADGKILKSGGPRGLVGKNINKLRQHFDRMKNAPAAKEVRYQAKVNRQARAWGITPEQYQQAADEVFKHQTALHATREEAKARARKRLGVDAGDLRRLEEQGFDYGSGKVKDLDTIGRELASEYPELGWGHGYSGDTGVDQTDYDRLLWDLVKEGKQSPPNRHSPEFHDQVDEHLERQLGTPGDDQGDTDFNFGANDDPDDPSHYEFALRMATDAKGNVHDDQNGRFAKKNGSAGLSSGSDEASKGTPKDQRSEVRQNPPIEISGDEYGPGIAPTEIREHALSYALQHFRGKSYVNRSSGKTIKVGRRGICKTLSHLPDAGPALAMARLPEILESATFVVSVPAVGKGKNVRAFHYFTAEISIAGQPMLTMIKVFEDNNGDWYYDQHVTPK